MADVSGHGAASAFVTVMLHTLIVQYRDTLWQTTDITILHPRRVLQRLNRDFCRHNLDKHLTMLYGVIDLEKNSLAYSSGGQFPCPLLFDGEEVQILDCRGRPVGLFDDAEYNDRQVDLPETFDLVLVSDGILELMPADKLQQRYSALLSRSKGIDLDLDDMTAGLDVLADKHLPDDIALMVIDRNGHDE
jgi:serine phosphatase RsbU (regulator of sigma subunit)